MKIRTSAAVTLYFALIFTFMLPLSFLRAQSSSLELRTYLDRTTVGVGEQFSLTVELSGSQAQSAPSPKLPDLSSFSRYLGYNTSQSFQMINGNMNASKSMVHYYIAETEGTYKIPSITLDFNGQTLRSDPIDVKIVSGPTATSPPSGRQPQSASPGQRDRIEPITSLEDNLFLKAEVDTYKVYVQQPVTVSFKIYTRVDVSNYIVSEMPDLLGFWIEDYELPPRPVTKEEVVGGKRYLVAEIKKTALFPTAAGEKTIDPLEIEAEVRIRDRSTRDIFDRFFDDDFFSSPFGRTVRTKIASKPVNINVTPLPEEGRPADFSGAVGRFKLESSLDKEQVTANEALSLKIKISGTGNIKMLPEPEIAFPREFEIYDPKVEQRVNRTGNSISGSKECEYVLIPRRGGEFRIPSFSFSYFDPDAGIYKTLETLEYTLPVAASDGSAVQIPAGFSRRNIEYIGKDIRFIKPAAQDFHQIGSYFYQSFWFVFLIALGILALAGAGIYRQRTNRMAKNIAYARSLKAQKTAKQRLSRARKLMTDKNRTEFYAELSQALLGFVADKLNLPIAGLMTDEIRERLKERGVETAVISEMLDCLRDCDFYRFAPTENIQTEMEIHYHKSKDAIIKLDKAKLS